jgi:hypothetical protein
MIERWYNLPSVESIGSWHSVNSLARIHRIISLTAARVNPTCWPLKPIPWCLRSPWLRRWIILMLAVEFPSPLTEANLA